MLVNVAKHAAHAVLVTGVQFGQELRAGERAHITGAGEFIEDGKQQHDALQSRRAREFLHQCSDLLTCAAGDLQSALRTTEKFTHRLQLGLLQKVITQEIITKPDDDRVHCIAR